MNIPSINTVAIAGGTHGNELTGVHLVQKFEQYPHLVQRSPFRTLTLLSNPLAIQAGRRYIDLDLNRCFRREDLNNSYLQNYEQQRAKEIARTFQQAEVNFVIDLHSTTAAMGITLILNHHHPFLLALAAHLIGQNPEIKVLQYAHHQENVYLRGLAELGLTLEVGPVLQGKIDPIILAKTEATIIAILDYLEQYSLGKLTPSTDFCTVYQQIQTIDYPRNLQGKIQAAIAPQIQDYQPLSPGMAIFYQNQEQIIYRGKSTVYPVFIGEAAYVEKGIAMALTEKYHLKIKPWGEPVH
ncbi:MAG: aspartoacylase [Microcystaceae cyanobacterium]